MTSTDMDTVEALKLELHGKSIGVVVHYGSNKNTIVFDPIYRSTPDYLRNTFTLSQLVKPEYLLSAKVSIQKLPPVLSNLLPEGTLREWISGTLKIHTDNEFSMLAYTGLDLPGALVAKPIAATDIPDWALDSSAVKLIDVKSTASARDANGFSLAGVQIKFSGTRNNGRFNLTNREGDWIIKIPSHAHSYAPENEYSSMHLAKLAGVDIPEIDLIPMGTVDNLPDIERQNDSLAYTIKRFDRVNGGRVHTEDFNQVFEIFALNKYDKINYEQIGSILNRQSSEGLADVQQMARRLAVNILLGNGDAHAKNWSLIYPDRINPRLSPAYDIVMTKAYIPGESTTALNMARTKEWYAMTMDHFKVWSDRIGTPWPAIKVHVLDAVDRARTTWAQALNDLPMHKPHKKSLIAHWSKLDKDFKI